LSLKLLFYLCINKSIIINFENVYVIRAAAVIGPHGGAFGNIYLCSWNTTIIEFNVPWTPRTADGDSRYIHI
jgi:hypothetical protein